MLPADFDTFPRRLGPYVIVQLLGEGGMGSVYLALMGSRRSPEICVVKQMGSVWSSFSARQMAKLEQRFRREAEITMALSHPSIAKTFAFHSDSPGPPYLVQELIDGFDLRALVLRLSAADEPIPVPLATHVVREVAGALVYLHGFAARGLVHRDVTPENVMVSYAGDVKLIDFGVAKVTAVPGPVSQPNLVGKADWMAPEMLRGAPPDARVDVYALGLLAWYLLTRRDPATTLSYREPPRTRLPPPSAFNPEVPLVLDRVVERAIAPHPGSRFQTARDLRQALARFLTTGYPARAELAGLVERAAGPARPGHRRKLVEEARALLDDPPAPRRPAVGSPSSARKRGRAVRLLLGSAAVVLAVSVLGFGAERVFDVPLVHSTQPSRPPARRTELVSSSSQASPAAEALPGPSAARLALAATVAVVPMGAASSDRSSASEGKPEGRRTVRGPARPHPDALLALAMDSFERGELPKALRQANAAIGRGVGAPGFLLVGRILALERDLAGAKDAFESALRVAPDNAEARRRLERLRLAFPENGP